jgi:alpha-D-xyloside xylohydrolase
MRKMIRAALFQFNDATHTLTIGARHGKFPGMLRQRTFRVVVVDREQGAGLAPEPNANAVINYSGKAMTVKLP